MRRSKRAGQETSEVRSQFVFDSQPSREAFIAEHPVERPDVVEEPGIAALVTIEVRGGVAYRPYAAVVGTPVPRTRDSQKRRGAASRPLALSRSVGGLADPFDELGKLPVEALRVLPEGHVTGTRVPGGFGGRTDGEHMVGHRREHDRIRPAVRDEDRHGERCENVVAVDLTGDQGSPDLAWNHHVPGEGGAPVLLAERLGCAGAKELADSGDARAEIGRAGALGVLEEPGTDVLET